MLKSPLTARNKLGKRICNSYYEQIPNWPNIAVTNKMLSEKNKVQKENGQRR